MCQVISGHQWPVFSVLHVAHRSRRHSDVAGVTDTSVDGTYVISADTTDRHISVWSVRAASGVLALALNFRLVFSFRALEKVRELFFKNWKKALKKCGICVLPVKRLLTAIIVQYASRLWMKGLEFLNQKAVNCV